MIARGVCRALLLVAGCDRVFGLGDPYQDARPPPDAPAPDAPGEIQPVQAECVSSQAFISQPTNKPLDLMLTMPTTSGNLLVAALNYTDSQADSSSLTTPAANGFTLVTNGVIAWTRTLQVYVWPAAQGGLTAFEATASPNATGPGELCISEYTGATANPATPASAAKTDAANPGTIDRLAADVVAGQRVYFALAIEGPNFVVTSQILQLRGSSADSRIWIEDGTTGFDASEPVATINGSPNWGAVAIVLDPR